MNRLILIVLLQIFANLAIGQQKISGTIKDVSGNPLSGVWVSSCDLKNTAYSRSNGTFEIEVQDKCTKLQFSKQNYNIKFVEINNSILNVTLDIYDALSIFDFSLEELFNIKVSTANKNSEDISRIPASVIVLQREEIAKIGYQSTENILQDILGMYLIDDYSWTGSKNYGVRGFFATGSFNNMVVLVNGVDQRCDVQFSAYITEKFDIPVEAIDRIEVIRGPMSVIYGSGAFFGAINIITNDPEQTVKSNEVVISGGNYNKQRGFVQFKGKGDEFSYSVFASYYSDKGIDEPFSNFMTNPSIATEPVAGGGWNLKSDRSKGLLYTNRKMLNFNSKLKNVTTNFGLVISQKGTVESTFGAGKGHGLIYLSGYGSVKYEQPLNQMIKISAKLDAISDNHWVDDNFFYPTDATNNISRNTSFDFELNTTITPSDKLNIISGVTTKYIQDYMTLVDYPLFGYNNSEWFADDVYIFSFLSQINYNISSKLSIVAGFRLENINPYSVYQSYPNADPLLEPTILTYSFTPVNKVEFIPRLSFIYQINEGNALKLLYGKAIQQPSVTSNLDMVNSNRTLQSADIQTYELAYQSFINSDFSVNTSLFYNRMNHLISRINTLDNNGNIVVISSNAGKNTTMGAELSIRIKPVSNFIIDVKSIFQQSEDERAGYENIEKAYSPHLLVYLNAIYTLKNFDFSISGRYVDKMYTAWDPQFIDINQLPITLPSTAPYSGRIGRITPSHFNIGANIRINNLFKTGLYVAGNISNMLNQKIYYPTTLSNPQFDKGTLGFGRWINFTLGFKF